MVTMRFCSFHNVEKGVEFIVSLFYLFIVEIILLSVSDPQTFTQCNHISHSLTYTLHVDDADLFETLYPFVLKHLSVTFFTLCEKFQLFITVITLCCAVVLFSHKLPLWGALKHYSLIIE